MHKRTVTTRSMATAGQAAPQITLADVRRTVCDAVAGSLAVNTGFRIEKYFGDISAEAEEWIDNYEDTTTLKGWDDSQRFKNFNQFLEGDAKNWYKLYVKKATNPPADWAALRTAFIDYHVPQDREKELRDKMVNKQQGTDDVAKYITEKRLLCIALNPAMSFDEMKKHIIDGMHPEIKVTIIHKVNNNMAALEENAKNIEKGLKASDKWNHHIQQPSNQSDPLIAKTLTTMSSALEKLLITQEETKERLHELERQNRSENRDRPEERHVEFDRHGRRIIDRPRDNYVNNSRNSSYDSYRDYSTDGSHSPYRQNDDYWHHDKSERYPQDDRSKTLDYINRTPKLKHKPILKKPVFENARRFNENKGFNRENNCFICGVYGHIANQCPLKYRQESSRDHRANALHSKEYESEEDSDLIFQTIVINDHKYSALIDSGSTVSLISEMIIRKLGLNIRTYRGNNIKNVDGLPVSIVGEVDITVKVKLEGGFKETDIQAAVIRNFHFDVLLGNDYNKKANVMIDCRRKCLIWPKNNGEHCLSMHHFQPKSQNYIHLLRGVTLPPFIRVQVKVSPKDRVIHRTSKLLVKTEGFLFKKNKILVNETTIQFIGGKANVLLLNCSRKDITLKSGTVVGVFEDTNNSEESDIKDEECQLTSSYFDLSDSSKDDADSKFTESSHHVNMIRVSVNKRNLNKSSQTIRDSICYDGDSSDGKHSTVENIQQNKMKSINDRKDPNVENKFHSKEFDSESEIHKKKDNDREHLDKIPAVIPILKITDHTKNSSKSLRFITIAFLSIIIICMSFIESLHEMNSIVEWKNDQVPISNSHQKLFKSIIKTDTLMESPFIKLNKEHLKKFRDKQHSINITLQKKNPKTPDIMSRSNHCEPRNNAYLPMIGFEPLITVTSVIAVILLCATLVSYIRINREEIKTLKIMLLEAKERTQSIEELMNKISREKEFVSRLKFDGKPRDLNTYYNL